MSCHFTTDWQPKFYPFRNHVALRDCQGRSNWYQNVECRRAYLCTKFERNGTASVRKAHFIKSPKIPLSTDWAKQIQNNTPSGRSNIPTLSDSNWETWFLIQAWPRIKVKGIQTGMIIVKNSVTTLFPKCPNSSKPELHLFTINLLWSSNFFLPHQSVDLTLDKYPLTSLWEITAMLKNISIW